MHLLVTVKCGQRESRFRIPCGNGQKTFKWLGLVSAARYSSESPKGSLRMRESRQAQAAGTALIPSNITTSDTSFFHPEALLGEQLEDGAEVCVALAPRVAVDAAGHPKTSRWSTIAFELSDPRKPFREQAMRDEYSAQEAKRTALEAMEADKRRGTMARKGSRLREVIKSQLPDRNAVHEAMHEDWFAMGKHRVLEALVADKQEQQKVKAVFTAHYVQLDELFKTYAASGSSIATAQEIEFNEFTEFVHNANLAEGPGSQQVSAVASFHETKHIERPAFFNALLWFALFWAGHPDGQPDPLSRPGSSASGKPSSGNSTAYLAKFEKITNASRQLLQLLEEKILPLVHKRLPGALGKIALDQDDVLSLFYDAEEDLRGIFRARANTSDDEITITEFVSVVDDAGLIGRGGAAARGRRGRRRAGPRGVDDAHAQDVRQAFAASQSEVAFAAPGHEKKKKSESSRRDEARDIRTSASCPSPSSSRPSRASA
ncbi:hypothetical protein JL720_14114 [Aureococcus anophagefferens]|nr:hypothetical protein JL720_14114 [Aureococcus anophagefferens]